MVSATDLFVVREALAETLVNASIQEKLAFYKGNRAVLLDLFNEGDGDVTEFLDQIAGRLDEFGEVIADDTEATRVADVVETEVSSMEARQEAEQPKVPLTEEQRKAKNRARLAFVLRENEFYPAADAVESDIESLDGFGAAKAMTAIREAVKNGGAQYGRENWEKVAWAIFYQLKAVANRASEDKALFFLSPVIRAFVSLTTNQGMSEGILKGAELVLKSAKPADEWSRWALEALDRLINSKEENEINGLLRNNPELAQHARAEELIEALLAGVRDAVIRQREENRQAKVDKEARRVANQANRAAASQGMKGSNQKADLVGKGKSRKRSANDPNRRK